MTATTSATNILTGELDIVTLLRRLRMFAAERFGTAASAHNVAAKQAATEPVR